MSKSNKYNSYTVNDVVATLQQQTLQYKSAIQKIKMLTKALDARPSMEHCELLKREIEDATKEKLDALRERDHARSEAQRRDLIIMQAQNKIEALNIIISRQNDEILQLETAISKYFKEKST